MIRRQVEYVIRCDAERVLGADCPEPDWHAFCDGTYRACEASAVDDGWWQATARYWLCPRCKHKHPGYQQFAANLETMAAAVGVELKEETP